MGAFDSIELYSARMIEETLAMSGASVAMTSPIPAGSIPIGISTRVLTAITGATGYDTGDGTDVDRWGANTPIAQGSTSDNTDWTAQAIVNETGAITPVLTAIGGPFTAGSVAIRAIYLEQLPA